MFNKFFKNFFKIFVWVCFTTLIIEFFFRFTGLLKTSEEKSGYHYIYKYRNHHDSWFHTWNPNDTIRYNQKEFSYLNIINEFGNREKPIDLFIDTNAIKIICLGDSFTEGDGAPYDSTWVKRFEFLMNENFDTNFICYNAGVCGSDVFYTFKLLEQKLIELNPSIIIESINDSDMPDIVYRGGKERFNEDGSTSGKVGPTWEKYYAKFHIFRFFSIVFLRYDSNLIKYNKQYESEIEALKLLKNQVIETEAWCRERGIKYIAIIHPVPAGGIAELEDVFLALTDEFKELPFVYNSTDMFIEKLQHANPDKYRWKENIHFNSYGYSIMGDIYFEIISERLKKDFF